MKNIDLECSCFTEGIRIQVIEDFPKTFEFSFWQYGFGDKRKLSFSDKLRWIFQIIIKGVPYSDMVILDIEKAIILKDFLKENLKE